MMSVTKAKVKKLLDPEEPDYEKAAALGLEAIPHLEDLIKSEDKMLASKAVYLAGLISGDKSKLVLNKAVASPSRLVRIATAATARNLTMSDALLVIKVLIRDTDPSVRRMAIKSLDRLARAGRYLGNTNSKEVHDLDNEQTGANQCQIDEIIAAVHAKTFIPDTLEQAHNEGYDNCAHCIGGSIR